MTIKPTIDRLLWRDRCEKTFPISTNCLILLYSLNPFIHSFNFDDDDQIIEFFKEVCSVAGDRFLLMIHDI